jgi:hypothetical protein
MTAATRRGEFFVIIRDKLSAILSNFPQLSLFGPSPAECVFMGLGGGKEGVKNGDAYGNRTRAPAVRGLCPNR